MREDRHRQPGFSPPLAPDRFFAVELRGLATRAVAGGATLRRERRNEAFLDQARAEAESVANARSRFLANMSHELRRPLNAIIGFSDSRVGKPATAFERAITGIRWATIHESVAAICFDLINDVLDMSKIEADRFSPTLEAVSTRPRGAAERRRMLFDLGVSRTAPENRPARRRHRRRSKSRPIGARFKQIRAEPGSQTRWKFTPAGGQGNVVAGIEIAAASFETEPSPTPKVAASRWPMWSASVAST